MKSGKVLSIPRVQHFGKGNRNNCVEGCKVETLRLLEILMFAVHMFLTGRYGYERALFYKDLTW